SGNEIVLLITEYAAVPVSRRWLAQIRPCADGELLQVGEMALSRPAWISVKLSPGVPFRTTVMTPSFSGTEAT
ncbi:MAG: hypothetical protein PHT00_04220, partial [Candidatus Methanomethylophilus sp.]|nr:hypothetical protein [Methanomethylophilus sp.]